MYTQCMYCKQYVHELSLLWLNTEKQIIFVYGIGYLPLNFKLVVYLQTILIGYSIIHLLFEKLLDIPETLLGKTPQKQLICFSVNMSLSITLSNNWKVSGVGVGVHIVSLLSYTHSRVYLKLDYSHCISPYQYDF